MDEMLKINNLYVSYQIEQKCINVLKDVSLNIKKGETIGIMGESGCGKSTLADAILKILPSNGKIEKGEILFNNNDLTKLHEKELNKIRGNEISMVFQNTKDCLNPVFTIGDQLVEHYIRHKKVKKKEAYERALEMLSLVKIPVPEKSIKKYPHEFSGGELQRIMLAIALMCKPKLLIADEITSALDLRTQREIIKLLKDLKNKLGMSIVFITHDLRTDTIICDRICVMDDGTIVENNTNFIH